MKVCWNILRSLHLYLSEFVPILQYSIHELMFDISIINGTSYLTIYWLYSILCEAHNIMAIHNQHVVNHTDCVNITINNMWNKELQYKIALNLIGQGNWFEIYFNSTSLYWKYWIIQLSSNNFVTCTIWDVTCFCACKHMGA